MVSSFARRGSVSFYAKNVTRPSCKLTRELGRGFGNIATGWRSSLKQEPAGAPETPKPETDCGRVFA